MEDKFYVVKFPQSMEPDKLHNIGYLDYSLITGEVETLLEGTFEECEQYIKNAEIIKQANQARQNITKAGIEKILCESVAVSGTDINGYDLIANLMILNVHEFNKYVGKLLSRFEFDYDAPRSEGWRSFSDAVSRVRFEDKKYVKKELSPKTKRLRDATYALALLADCFEYIEKSELKEKEAEE